MPLDSSDHKWDYRGWRCEKPRCSEYHFNLLSVPGRLILTGDLGVLVVERTYDMISWARGSIHSLDYFAEKVPKEIETEEWDAECAKGWISEIDADIAKDEYGEKKTELWTSELREELFDLADGQCAESDFMNALYRSDFVDCADFPNLKNWKPGFLWQRECIKWFLSHYEG
jgi:hypothetical protein